MDPISLAIGAIGLGMQIYGGMKQADNAKETAQVSSDVAKQEQSINDAKQKQMEIEGRRTQLENIRNNQRARAMAESSAVSQGAEFGSGLQGGIAQINDQTNFNMSGVNSALGIGREINSFNQNISKDRMQLATLQGQSATNQGLMSLGGAVMKAGPIVGQLSQGFGGNSGGKGAGSFFMGGGSPSGYGTGK